MSSAIPVDRFVVKAGYLGHRWRFSFFSSQEWDPNLKNIEERLNVSSVSLVSPRVPGFAAAPCL